MADVKAPIPYIINQAPVSSRFTTTLCDSTHQSCNNPPRNQHPHTNRTRLYCSPNSGNKTTDTNTVPPPHIVAEHEDPHRTDEAADLVDGYDGAEEAGLRVVEVVAELVVGADEAGHDALVVAEEEEAGGCVLV
jgi:hypothetical protein